MVVCNPVSNLEGGAVSTVAWGCGMRVVPAFVDLSSEVIGMEFAH